MNKTSKLFMGFASLAMLAACSDDAPVMDGGNTNPNEEGTTAYLSVTILDANDIYTRSRELNENEGFEDASGNEGTVGTARFYFFSENGNYMGQSTVWNGGSTDTGDANIEFKSPTLVVLENIKQDDKEKDPYPTYMVTVLNGRQYTNEYLAGATLASFSKELTNWGSNDENGFIMTTTSYYEGADAADHVDTYYYATKLDKTKFQRTAEEAMKQPGIDVYVERLAARVQLDTEDYFPVNVTVFGADGDNPEIGKPAENDPSQAATQLYVHIDGWYINGVQRNSYLSKQLGTGWDNTTFDLAKGTGKWVWNKPALHRSYWGMSCNYDNITATLDENVETNLLFFPYNNANVKTVEQTAYCNENTSTVSNLQLEEGGLPNQRKLTSIVIKATVGTGNTDATFKSLNLVEHNGFYYTDDRFIAYVLGVANANICTKNENTIPNTQVDTDYTPIKVEGNYIISGDNSRVYVETNYGDDIDTENLWIKKDGVWTPIKVDTINAALKNATSASNVTRRATDGAMFYNVPIAHLNTATYDENGDLVSWKEGTFGVVRNHAYKIKINSIKRLGTGVFDPKGDHDTTPIVPDEDPKDPNWFLGAQINILSWKIVSNSVDL